MPSLNDALAEAREAGEEHEEALASAYLATVRKAGRTAAARFEERALTLQASASWMPPEISDVMAFAVNADRIRAMQRRMLASITGQLVEIPGVAFNALMPPTQRQLEALGLRAIRLAGDIRQPVADAIAKAWAEGLSVVDTAKAIRVAVYDLAPHRSEMLARTDLISLSNGANQAAVETLNDASVKAGEPAPVASKTWFSAQDSRVRPTHVEADGQTVPIGTSYVVGGVSLRYPGDPGGTDEEVVNCRCTELYNETAAGDSHPRVASAASGSPDGDVPSQERQEVEMSVTETEAPAGTLWVSDIAFEGLSTGDGRYMVPGSLGWRDLPLTLMSMIETPEFGGHAGAQVAGRMDTMEKDSKLNMDGDALPSDVTAVRSTGVFDMEGDRGEETQRMVEDETMRGISIDLAVIEWAFRDPETGELIDPNEMTDEQWEKAWYGEYEFAVVEGEIMAATVCPTPAFADARIAILASGVMRPRVWKASAAYAASVGVEEGQMMTTLIASARVVEDEEEPLVAASRPARPRQLAAPIAPPRSWFARAESPREHGLTITDAGEVYGWLALWDSCHTGFVNGDFASCVRAPRSLTRYAKYHVGEMKTDEGELLPIGKLTYDTGHAGLSLGLGAARCHYDETGACGAYVRAVDGERGIWISGALRSDITPEGVRDLRACPPSGDWRSFEHNLELIAALAVPVPGFPVARGEMALAASADRIEVTALILTMGAVEESDLDADYLALEIEHGPDVWDLIVQGKVELPR